MNLEFFENLEKTMKETIENRKMPIITNGKISPEELAIAQKLDAIEEFTVDRLEEKWVVLENRKTRQMQNIARNELPEKIQEGDILQKIHGKYQINEHRRNEIEQRLQNEFENLWEEE